MEELPGHVIMKLYNFVIRPLRQQIPKRARTGTGTGTGGLKRKSMDENVEAEKIRKLEERLRSFNEPTGNKDHSRLSAVSMRHDDSDRSSDDSSSEDSGSDSD